MKTLSLLIFTLFCTICSKAQPWIGPVSGNIYYNQGNVGIGTTTPTNKLQIGANPSGWVNNDLVVSNSAGNKALAIASDANMSYVWSSGRLDLWGNSTYTMSLSSGNVGIGTTSPQTLFQVGGDIPSSAQATYKGKIQINGLGGLETMSGLEFISSSYAAGYGWKIVVPDEGVESLPLVFGSRKNSSSWTEKMRIDNKTGNVGIGTTTPGNKLDVNGTIRAKEVKVESGWADYVFDKGYNLQNLSEVELYINKHKHLPDVPDANEVEKNGVNLGEMNALLLKKIEELTLYAIKQNKKVEEQSLYSIEQNKRSMEQAKKIETLEKTVNNLIAK